VPAVQGQIRGRGNQAPVRDAKMLLGKLEILCCKFSLHARKNLSEYYPLYGHAPSRSLASPVVGQKGLNNSLSKGRKIISLPRAPICLGPVLTP
jgi:hypothetical protein